MSKQEQVKELFLNQPSKHWHFEEILRIVHLSRPQAALALKRLQKEDLIHKMKPKQKMPYYVAKSSSSAYRIKKRLFALQQLEQTGFLLHLSELPHAKAVVLFGSFSRSDWHKESDIDLFIYGSKDGFSYGTYRRKLHRQIQIIECQNAQELSQLSPGLLKNIFEGYRIKGSLEAKVYA